MRKLRNMLVVGLTALSLAGGATLIGSTVAQSNDYGQMGAGQMTDKQMKKAIKKGTKKATKAANKAAAKGKDAQKAAKKAMKKQMKKAQKKAEKKMMKAQQKAGMAGGGAAHQGIEAPVHQEPMVHHDPVPGEAHME